MKTAKYVIAFDSIDTDMCYELVISKKEYNRQLAFLRQQVERTKDNECPCTERIYKHDHGTFTETTIYFSVATATTYLSALECKEGYHFTK